MVDELRILMISPQYRPIVGGYERACERLSRTLAGMGHQVSVVTERRDRSWPALERQDGVEIRRLWCLHRPRLHTATSLVSLAFFLVGRGLRFQVWHVHQYGYPAALATALGWLLHRPVVIKLTNSGAEGLAESTRRAALGPLLRRILQGVDGVVALSRETQTEALAFGVPAGRVRVLGNGVDSESFRPRSDAERSGFLREQGISAAGIVLFVGRLAVQKNLDGLLAAWKTALPQLPPDWKLVLIGEGPLRADLESSLDRQRLTASVLLAGAQSNVERWMAASDIYAVSSHWEGLSNTMLEAMSSALPVVATRVSGSAEALEQTGAGMVVDVGDMNGVAQALVRLAADPVLCRRLGDAGRATIQRQYGIAAVAARHAELYRDLLAGDNSGQGRPLRCAE